MKQPTSATDGAADLSALAVRAWQVRDRAIVYGDTKVGSALATIDGDIYTGCNVEQLYRNSDMHAEVSAINNMVANNSNIRRLLDQKIKPVRAIVIVAERERFLPCGTCMDWIMQFGGPDCTVVFQSEANGEFQQFKARELMPHYPR